MNNTITLEKINDKQLRMIDGATTTTFDLKLVFDNRTHRNWIELPANSIKRKYIPDTTFANATTVVLEAKKAKSEGTSTPKTGKKSEIDILRDNLDETDRNTLDELIAKATLNIKKQALQAYVQQIKDIQCAIEGLGLNLNNDDIRGILQ